MLLDTGSFHDIAVINHRERSIIALPLPISVNGIPQKALELISGVGKKRATEIILKRPVGDMKTLADLLKDVDKNLAVLLSV